MARLLQQDGCRVVAVSDSKEAIHSEAGFEVESLYQDKQATRKLQGVYCQSYASSLDDVRNRLADVMSRAFDAMWQVHVQEGSPCVPPRTRWPCVASPKAWRPMAPGSPSRKVCPDRELSTPPAPGIQRNGGRDLGSEAISLDPSALASLSCSLRPPGRSLYALGSAHKEDASRAPGPVWIVPQAARTTP